MNEGFYAPGVPTDPVSDELRSRLLRALWDNIRGFTADSVRAYPAAARAIDAGADPADLVAALTHAQYEAVFGVLYLLDYHSDVERDEDAVHGWVLVDADLDDDDPVPGSPDTFHGLYEELLSADPLGLEGRDFLT